MKVVISSGDPAGCGPYITLEAIKRCKDTAVDFLLIGSKRIFERIPAYKKLKAKFTFINADLPGIENVRKGYPSKSSGQAALSCLDSALRIMNERGIRRLVTAPLSKEAVKLSYPGFVGHTEYLAKHFGTKKFAMMMASPGMKVVLFTRHINLRKVSSAMNKDDLVPNLKLVYASLKKMFSISRPKIAFASVNPHTGVDTFLEKEEELIVEAIKTSKLPVKGPYPSDTVFIPQNLKKYDCIICPYHDQGMIPFKLLSFKDGVNLTLGLPIIRTSPAHGTAFDLMRAGKQPFHSSMLTAINLALRLRI